MPSMSCASPAGGRWAKPWLAAETLSPGLGPVSPLEESKNEDGGRASVSRDVDHRGLREPREIGVLGAHCVRVGSCLKDNTLVLREPNVGVHVEPVEIAEGRHRSQLTVRKHGPELRILGQARRMSAKRSGKLAYLHFVRGRDDHHDGAIVSNHDHRLCQLLGWHVLAGGHTCSSARDNSSCTT